MHSIYHWNQIGIVTLTPFVYCLGESNVFVLKQYRRGKCWIRQTNISKCVNKLITLIQSRRKHLLISKLIKYYLPSTSKYYLPFNIAIITIAYGCYILAIHWNATKFHSKLIWSNDYGGFYSNITKCAMLWCGQWFLTNNSNFPISIEFRSVYDKPTVIFINLFIHHFVQCSCELVHDCHTNNIYKIRCWKERSFFNHIQWFIFMESHFVKMAHTCSYIDMLKWWL